MEVVSIILLCLGILVASVLSCLILGGIAVIALFLSSLTKIHRRGYLLLSCERTKQNILAEEEGKERMAVWKWVKKTLDSVSL